MDLTCDIATVIFSADKTAMDIIPPDGYKWSLKSMAMDCTWFEKLFDLHDAFDIRKRYEAAKIKSDNDPLTVIVLTKRKIIESDDFDKFVNDEMQVIDAFIRRIRFLTESCIHYVDIGFHGYAAHYSHYTDIPSPDHIWNSKSKSFAAVDVELINNSDIDFDFHKYGSSSDIAVAYGMYDLSYSINYNVGMVLLMSALEALLGKEQHGIKEQLAKRTSLFLGNGDSERDSIYKEIRHLYKVRSEYIHKGLWKEEYSDVKEGRSLLRRCLLKIMMNPEYTNKQERIKSLTI